MDIQRQTVGHKNSKHGQTAVGTSAVRITPNKKFEAARGILIKTAGAADDTPNTKTVWVGYEGVTATGGFGLAPGEALHIPIEDPAALFVISTSASQAVFWMVV